MAKPWKWDVAVYDRPGWNSISCNHQRVHLLPDGRLGVKIWSTEMGAASGDLWKDNLDDRTLTSDDGGRSWVSEPVRLPGMRTARTASGRLVSVMTAELVRPPRERAAHLKEVGLEHLIKPGSFYQYQLWPKAMHDDLVAQGYLVHDSGQGCVATCTGQTLCISDDDGRTWTHRELTGFPFHAKIIGFFRDPVVTPAGTILGPCWGMPNPERRPVTERLYVSYCLRGEDDGETWELIPVGNDPERKHSFDECHLLRLASGRLLMMMRHDGGDGDRNLFQSFSDDDGRTWTPPERTPMWGFPPFVMQLRSGALLCCYTHRRAPFGIRACLTRDEARTWDIDREIVVRDDAFNGAVSYPTAVQLDDDSLFMFYGTCKPCPPATDAERAAGTGARRYAAGSRFSEEYVRAEGG